MTKSKTISYDNRAHFFWVLATMSILALSVYFYAMNATARNIAARQDLERQVSESTSSLNSLEFAYIELKNSITIELAHLYGFKEVENPLYVSRARQASLTLNTVNR